MAAYNEVLRGEDEICERCGLKDSAICSVQVRGSLAAQVRNRRRHFLGRQ
jgi:hypothetical protein